MKKIMPPEKAAEEANTYIALLKQHLGPVVDASDQRVFILNSGQEGYVDGFVIDKTLFWYTITVNFYELPRNKLFQLENQSIIGNTYKPSFAHFVLQKYKALVESLNIQVQDVVKNTTTE